MQANGELANDERDTIAAAAAAAATDAYRGAEDKQSRVYTQIRASEQKL